MTFTPILTPITNHIVRLPTVEASKGSVNSKYSSILYCQLSSKGNVKFEAQRIQQLIKNAVFPQHCLLISP